MNYVYIWAAGIISGALGAMGLGGGGVLILYLTLIAGVPQIEAQGINLIFFIPAAAVATITYLIKKKITLKKLLPVILFGIPGAAAGTALSKLIGGEWTGRIFGAGLVIMGIRELIKSRKKH